MYSYDIHGFLSDTPIEGRTTLTQLEADLAAGVQ